MLVTLAMLSHPLLDVCTSYGTQLLMPLARTRFALDSLPVVAPLLTAFLLLGLLLGTRRTGGPGGTWPTATALGLTGVYLLLGIFFNQLAEDRAAGQLARQGIVEARVHAYPTMLQLPHRRIVALTPDQIHVGFVTIWRDCDIQWAVSERQDHPAARALLASPEGQIFAWFANGMIDGLVEPVGDNYAVELSDLRYGFIAGTTRGMWGVTAELSNALEILTPPKRVQHRPEVSWGGILDLFRSAYPRQCPPATSMPGLP